jgi:hypothetical protein
MADRLAVDLRSDGTAGVLPWPEHAMPEELANGPLVWPLDTAALEDLRWYPEDYLLAPFGVREDRGPVIQSKLASWGEQVFGSGCQPSSDTIARQVRDDPVPEASQIACKGVKCGHKLCG